MNKYCVTCNWTGVNHPSNYYIGRDDKNLDAVLSWLEMERGSTQCIPSNIQVFRFVEQSEVDEIRKGLRSQ